MALASALLAWSVGPWGAVHGQADTPTAVERCEPDMRAAVARLAQPLSLKYRRALDTFYGEDTWRPAWIDASCAPTHTAFDALAALHDAPLDGLDAFAEDARALERAATAPGGTTNSQAADFDARLTLSMLRFLHALHTGRVDPASLGLNLRRRAEPHDTAHVLRLAISAGDVRRAVRTLSPQLTQYALLESQLARYRSMAGDSSLTLPPSFASAVIRPGDAVPALDQLCRLLIALGDLSDAARCAPDGFYTDDIQGGVVRFQARHGLAADGIIGPATRTALMVPLARRARQIAMAMERLRWVSDIGTGPLVAVNIPMFRLWAWDSVPSAVPALDMAVVVGRAAGHATPVFADEIERIVLRPYWNVPRSIVAGEMIPALRRDPAYAERLAREGYEVLEGSSATPVAPSPASLARAAAGAARVRQRPGPANALGLVKFVLPNDEDVYLHDTASRMLFSQTRRDFSHGCIRLEKPNELAAWLLRDVPDWTIERTRAESAGAATRDIPLRQPVPVIIFYTTAVVTPSDGQIHFLPDLYGHDRRLDAVF